MYSCKQRAKVVYSGGGLMIIPNQNNVIYKNSNDRTSSGVKSFSFDFSIGDFKVIDGKLVEIDGIDALKAWIVKALKTDKSKFRIYDNTDYGITNLKELITGDYPLPFIVSEIEREVKETLLKNSNIKSVQDFKFERNKRMLTVSFSALTIYGDLKSEVIL